MLAKLSGCRADYDRHSSTCGMHKSSIDDLFRCIAVARTSWKLHIDIEPIVTALWTWRYERTPELPSLSSDGQCTQT